MTGRRKRVALALVVLGVPLIGASVLVTPGAELVHSTADSSTRSTNVTQMARYSYGVYNYSDLSERGQDLYVQTLEHDGEYRVPVGEGAPEFQYPTMADLRAATQDGNLSALQLSSLVIVRPDESGSLPPADEEPGHERYEAMRTMTKEPAVGSGAYVPQLLALVLGMVSVVAGAYLVVTRPA